MKRKNLLKRTIRVLGLLFVLMNVVAMFHAYKFTHFADSHVEKTKNARQLSTFGKIKTLFLGVDNPRPINQGKPTQPFETITIQSNKTLECWLVRADSAKGTVMIFHGFSGDKSKMLDKSDAFLKMGYNTLLVDFMGSGGSEGNQTTIGFKEAEEVKSCYEYLAQKGETNIYLFGTSMGAVAVLKAMADYPLQPKGILLESPFGSMYRTTCARFETMHAPCFPMAGILVFWGGVENGFWALGHNPTEYAGHVNCPTLLMYGEQDQEVSRGEIDEIYAHLKGPKTLKTYPLAAHENFLIQYKEQWITDIHTFLEETSLR